MTENSNILDVLKNDIKEVKLLHEKLDLKYEKLEAKLEDTMNTIKLTLDL
ncbi:MAG: hypothetical protein LBU55_03790 [Elusimicrobiota bacterium]|nr:hypothetical protein [Elusimicrobiota bacterium]